MDMKLNLLTKLGPLGLKLKVASPGIFIGLGTIGLIGTTVYACYQTTKLESTLEEDKTTREKLRTEYDERKASDDYSEEDDKAFRKELTNSYISSSIKVIKLYAGPVIIGSISLSAVLYSHVILKKRILGLGAAYATLSEGYSRYRNRVIDRYGEDVDKELRFGTTKMKLKDVDPDAVTEDNKKDKVDVLVEDPQAKTKTSDIANEYSDYARFFEDGCKGWEKTSEYNLAYLKGIQSKCNDILKSRGFLYLNEVYSLLDVPLSEAGQVVGWLDPEKFPECEGDGYVDFGIYDIYKSKSRDFVNGYERSILLDFNVDGVIHDKVWNRFKKK